MNPKTDTTLYLLRAPVKWVLFFLIIFYIPLITAQKKALIKDIEGDKKIFTKDQFISLFLEKAEIIKAQDQKIRIAKAENSQVKTQYFPSIDILVGAAPYPTYTYIPAKLIPKKSLHSKSSAPYDIEPADWDDSQALDDFGIRMRIKGSFEMPIYTFGRYSSMLDASREQVKAVGAEKEIALLKLKKEATAIYYSYLMAFDIKNFMEMGIKNLKEAESKLKKMLYEEKEGVSQKDLIKLRIEKEKFLAQYDQVKNEINTLSYIISEVLGKNWSFKEQYLAKTSFFTTLELCEDYLLNKSPYSDMVKSGIKAYEHLYNYEVSDMFPVFGIAGNYTLNYTSSVDEGAYPYTNSPYNGHSGEIGLGFSFNLNILEQITKIDKAKAKWKNVELEALFARRVAKTELRKKMNDLKSLDSKVRHTRKAHKYSKGWMTMEMMNYKNGIFNTKDLVDSVKTFFLNEYELILSIFQYNMKVEEIKELTGIEGERK